LEDDERMAAARVSYRLDLRFEHRSDFLGQARVHRLQKDDDNEKSRAEQAVSGSTEDGRITRERGR
jgi:hypothetical protein